MSSGESNMNKIDALKKKLESGIRDIFESGKYKKYLSTMAKFHQYSVNNIHLIYYQRPDATLVAGYNAWKEKFNRQVNKGEKGILIYAPMIYKKEVEKTIVKDGKERIEKKEITIPKFKAAYVFDISQTSGEPIHDLIPKRLNGGVFGGKKLLKALISASPVPIVFANITSSVNGYFDPQNKNIWIKEDLSEKHTIRTVVHEIAHAIMHNSSVGEKDSRTREVEAESVAYIICQNYGIDTSEYSFSNIALWSGEQGIEQLNKSMESIRSAAGSLIGKIDLNLKKEISKTNEAKGEYKINFGYKPSVSNKLNDIKNENNKYKEEAIRKRINNLSKDIGR